MIMKFVIYSITSPSGSIYIGQTVNLHKRLNRYRTLDCKSQRYLHRSLAMFGFEAHEVKILHELPVDIDRKVMDNYELFYYTAFKDAGFKMMNLKQAFGRGGGLHPETIEKIRQINLNRVYAPISESEKQRLRTLNIGRKCGPPSAETRRKISLSQKGKYVRPKTEAEKEHLRIKSTGLKLPQSAKDKVRAARSIPILQFDKQNNFIQEWASAKAACIKLNLCRGRMCVVLGGVNNNIYKGFKWVKKVA